MVKIVKYCGACEESFAQKFGFCPNCGGALKAFEMNPIQEEAKAAASEKAIETTQVFEAPKNAAPETNDFIAPAAAPPTKIYDIAPSIQTPAASAATIFPTNGSSSDSAVNVKSSGDSPRAEKTVLDKAIAQARVSENPPAKNPVADAKPVASVAAVAANGNGTGSAQKHQAANDAYQATYNHQIKNADDGFHITVIEEKNVGQRNLLLLGSMFLMISLVVGGVIFSLFNKDTLVGSIDAGSPLYVTPIDDAPVPIEVEKPPKKDNNDGGGGGGGGKEEQKEASKGRLVSQSDNPVTPPSVNIPQLKNPSLPVIMETQGKIKRPITEERPGLPNSSSNDPSNGTGSGGGIGGGRGTGMGGGIGTGEGNGRGSGSGNGNGNGNGNGTGDGTGRTSPPPPPPTKPPEPVGPTTPVNIISKPRPGYTDAARQNQITGTVTLRVTFLANGQIGSISPVSGLPYNLTEQAIAAARQLKFEPAKKNGVPQTVTKQVQYSFTIY